MNTSARFVTFILLCLGAGFTAGCSGGGGEGANPPDVLDGERKSDPDFVTTLAIKDATGQFRSTFSPGEQIIFELSVTNLSTQPMTVTRGFNLTHDFFVAPAGTRQIVWQATDGLSFQPVVEMDEFAPGETKTYPGVWNQDRNDGLPLMPGEYVARGFYAVLGFNEMFTHSEFGSDLIPFVID